MSTKKESFRRVPETCPAVDGAASDFAHAVESELRSGLDDFVNRVKEQTTSLRAALVEALDERDEARAERDAAQDEIRELGNQLASRDAEIEELRSQIDAMEATP